MGLPRVIVPASYVATVATSAARTQGRRAWVLSLVVMLLVLGLGVGSAVFLSRRAASAGGAASATTVSTGVEARPRAPLVIKRPPAPAATQPAEAPPRSATATAPAPTSKAGPPPALTVGPATDAQGALSAEVITRVVRARYSALAACIADAGDERGATTVTLVIATSGAVTSTQVASSTRRFATCAARVLRSLKFPTGDAITKVSVPLSLADQPR
jgi:hypothetical protein